MKKKETNLKKINAEWHDFGIPANIDNYYPNLSKEHESKIYKDVIEFHYLPKENVYVVQTWNGDFAVGEKSDLFKRLKKRDKQWNKEVVKKDKLKEKNIKKEKKKFKKLNKKKERKADKEWKKYKKFMNKKKGKKRNMKYKTKQVLKTILFATLGVGAVVGTASLISNVVEHYDTDLKTIHPNFSVGGLNEVGKAEKNEFAIYTKDLIEFRQLSLELDLDSEVDVDIFMYDEHGKYLSTVEMSELTYETDYTYNPKYCRLMITAPVEDDQIEWTEVYKYSSQLNVKVDNELHEEELTFYKSGSELFTITYCKGMTWADFVDSKYDNVRNVDFMLDGEEEDVSVLVYVTDRDGTHGYSLSLPEDDVWDTTDVYNEEKYVLSSLA